MKKLLSVVMVAFLVASFVHLAVAEGEVVVYNWEDYISPEALTMFEKETGIRVIYSAFTTNEDMMVQLRSNPDEFDVVFPSDYIIERLIKEGLLEPIDYGKVPNAEHIVDWLDNPDYDQDSTYSVPYMWGTVGILYDKERITGPIDSWSVLFTEEYKGEVFMLDSIRDTMGLALKYLGYSMNTRDPSHIQEATELLLKQKRDGIVKAYQVDETKDKMIAGEAILAVVWSGDAQYAISEEGNDRLAYAVPKEGSNVWVDGMVIPKSSRNKDNAHAFINFMSRPDIAKINCDYIQYSSPNKTAVELMGEEYTSNPNLNPPQEVIDRCEFFHDIEDAFLAFYNNRWSEIKNAK